MIQQRKRENNDICVLQISDLYLCVHNTFKGFDQVLIFCWFPDMIFLNMQFYFTYSEVPDLLLQSLVDVTAMSRRSVFLSITPQNNLLFCLFWKFVPLSILFSNFIIQMLRAFILSFHSQICYCIFSSSGELWELSMVLLYIFLKRFQNYLSESSNYYFIRILIFLFHCVLFMSIF